MANKKLFAPIAKKTLIVADTRTSHYTPAYSFSDKAALAQLAATGTFANTFYVKGEDQLKKINELAEKVPVDFLAKVAVYIRKESFMKDSAAFLLAVLSRRSPELFRKVFRKIIDNGKMLRNFVQVIRSGTAGRKSLGSAAKTEISAWLNQKADYVFSQSLGNDPSFRDVLCLSHARPSDAEHDALFKYLMGFDFTKDEKAIPLNNSLPNIVKEFESFKGSVTSGEYAKLPNLPIEMISSLPLSTKQWIELAQSLNWHATRMNLNTFERHGVFKDTEAVDIIAAKLADRDLILKNKVMPYQVLTAYTYAENVPDKIKQALHDAVDVALENVPVINGRIYICVDISGSMGSHVTGNSGKVGKLSYIDVAALFGASLLKKNENAELMLFNTDTHIMKFNKSTPVLKMAKMISEKLSGGTACQAPLEYLNKINAIGDGVFYFSDNESWAQSVNGYQGVRHYGASATTMYVEWEKFQRRNPKAKLVCLDVEPKATSQVPDGSNRLNIGGFSDNVFRVISGFLEAGEADFWVKKIEEIQI